MRRPPSHQNVLDPLAPEVAALLAAERRVPPPSAAREALILSRLQTAAAATGAATAAGIAATAATATANAAPATATGVALVGAALSKPLLILAATTTAVAAIGGGVAISHRQAKAPVAVTATNSVRPNAAVRAPAANARPNGHDAVDMPPHIAPVPPLLDVAADKSPPRSASSRAPRAPETAGPDIAAEATILEKARRALVAGDGAAALVELDRHAQHFPRGSLAEEREALGIRALLRAGKRAQAHSRAESFARRYPESVQGNAIARALREIH